MPTQPLVPQKFGVLILKAFDNVSLHTSFDWLRSKLCQGLTGYMKGSGLYLAKRGSGGINPS